MSSILKSVIDKKRVLFFLILLSFCVLINKFVKVSFVKESFNYVVPSVIRGFIKDSHNLLYKKDLKVPTIEDDEILIKVRSYLISHDEYCRDFSGVIISKGSKVKDFQYKDRVFGRISNEEYKKLEEQKIICPEVIAIKTKNKKGDILISKKPMSLTHVQASNIPYIANYLNGFIHHHFKKSDNILVTNGVSVLGSVLVYYLKNHVKLTATEEDKDELSKFRLLSYQDFKSDEDFKKHLNNNLEKFDYVFNIQGDTLDDKDLNLILKNNGVLINLDSDRKISIKSGVKLITIKNDNYQTANDFDKISTMINNGKIPVMVDKVFEMEELKNALDFKKNNKYNSAVNLTVSKE